jgi:Skp family chaperone for outer membrane proteins
MSEENKTNWLDLTKKILLIAIVAILVTFPGLYLVKKSQAQVGVVDVQTLLLEHEKEVTKELYSNAAVFQNADGTGVNNAALEQKTKQFVQKLEASIEAINKDCNCVLINKAALLTQSGKVKDYTEEVRKALKE